MGRRRVALLLTNDDNDKQKPVDDTPAHRNTQIGMQCRIEIRKKAASMQFQNKTINRYFHMRLLAVHNWEGRGKSSDDS